MIPGLLAVCCKLKHLLLATDFACATLSLLAANASIVRKCGSRPQTFQLPYHYIITLSGKRFRRAEILFCGKIAPSCTRCLAHRFSQEHPDAYSGVEVESPFRSEHCRGSCGSTALAKNPHLSSVLWSITTSFCFFLGFAAYEHQSGCTATGLVSSSSPSEALE